MPQDDIVHRDLTVERALYYAAKMRLPEDFTEDQIRNGARTPDLVPFLGGPASTTDQVGSELLARLNAAP